MTEKELRCEMTRCKHLHAWYCCAVCCKQESCPDACKNAPDKCGQAKEISRPYVVSLEQQRRQIDTSGFRLENYIVQTR